MSGVRTHSRKPEVIKLHSLSLESHDEKILVSSPGHSGHRVILPSNSKDNSMPPSDQGLKLGSSPGHSGHIVILPSNSKDNSMPPSDQDLTLGSSHHDPDHLATDLSL